MLVCAIFVSFTVSQTDVQHQVKVKIKKFSFHAAKKCQFKTEFPQIGSNIAQMKRDELTRFSCHSLQNL